jgi:hypothetical protein
MVRKKERIQPVVAKPLSDTEKRNLVTSFVTNNVKDNITKSDTEDVSKLVTNHVINNVTQSITESNTNIVTNSDTLNITNDITQKVTSNITEKVTNDVTKDATYDVTEKDINNVTEIDTKSVTKNVIMIKTISLGKKDIVAKFTSTKRSRPNYNLSEDTIDKIEKISDILGYKKAEFVDVYLNGTLTKVLKDLDKNNK